MTYNNVSLLFDNDIYSIIGNNGVGKSAITEMLFWCFYGQTVRNSKRVRPRSDDKLSAFVEITGTKNKTDL